MGRISGPLLDRIDIHIEVTPVKYEKLESDVQPETSVQITERVNKARKVQLERYKNNKRKSQKQNKTKNGNKKMTYGVEQSI